MLLDEELMSLAISQGIIQKGLEIVKVSLSESESGEEQFSALVTATAILSKIA